MTGPTSLCVLAGRGKWLSICFRILFIDYSMRQTRKPGVAKRYWYVQYSLCLCRLHAVVGNEFMRGHLLARDLLGLESTVSNVSFVICVVSTISTS
jgi:hypothetical protein